MIQGVGYRPIKNTGDVIGKQCIIGFALIVGFSDEEGQSLSPPPLPSDFGKYLVLKWFYVALRPGLDIMLIGRRCRWQFLLAVSTSPNPFISVCGPH